MFQELIQKINKAERIAIFNHINPDGDAHGSAFGLKLILLAMGKSADVFLREDEDATKEYRLLKGTENQGLDISDCDLKIAVDCADIERLGEFAKAFTGNTAALDHHITHKPFADTTVVMADAPATGEVVYGLAEAMGVEMTYDIAHNLYMAIVCDTGNFKFSSTTPRTHLVAAKLMEAGIDVSAMTKRLFDTKTIEYLNLYKKAIEDLEMYDNGKIAVLSFLEEDFEKANIREVDADGVVNLPNSVLGVEVGVYIRQRNDGFKISLRSNGNVNVAEIATGFGGGGHERASGFSMNLSLDEVKRTVVEKLTQAIDEVSI